MCFPKSALPIALLSLLPWMATAEPVNQADIDALLANNISTGYVTCASYFATLAENYRFYPLSPEKIVEAKTAQRQALHFSLIASKYTDTAEKTDARLLTQLTEQFSGMLQQAGSEFTNMQSLINEHDTRCKIAIQEPSKFVQSHKQQTAQQFVSID